MDEPFTFPVDRSQIMLFARAVLDTNPVYRDPDAPETQTAGGIVAPPTFVQTSAHWQPNSHLDPTRQSLAPAPAEPPPGGGGNLARVLHAEQRFDYHHPIYAGDTLSVTVRPGNAWEKQGRRGGKLVFHEIVSEYRNQDGVLCVVATAVDVETERAAVGG